MAIIACNFVITGDTEITHGQSELNCTFILKDQKELPIAGNMLTHILT